MPSKNSSTPILFVNSGVQLICFPLAADSQISVSQSGRGWQHCRCQDLSPAAEEPIIQYGYLQWQIVAGKIFLAVDTTLGTTEDGSPQYFAKASSLTSDVAITLTGLIDAQGKPFEALPPLEFILRPATADAGEDRQVHLVIDFGNSRTGGLLVEFRGDAHQEPMMTPLRLVNRFHLDAWNDKGNWDATNATWWFSSKTHWCTSPYLPAPGIDVVEYREQEKSGVFGIGGGEKRVPVTVRKTPRTFEEYSQVRMGREADDLAGGIDVEGDIRTGVSSPKRYLWARDSSWLEGANWHMADPFDRDAGSGRISENAHVAKLAGPLLRFISENDDADGSTSNFDQAPHSPRHAPRVLMQAALYELLCQAFIFVNSPAYQQLTGDAGRRRVLESLTLTFPSGMISDERDQLQLQADKAIAIFSSTLGRGQSPQVGGKQQDRQRPQLKLSIDEASAVHLTYLWSESRKLGGKPSLWFSVMGRTPAAVPVEQAASSQEETGESAPSAGSSLFSDPTPPPPRPAALSAEAVEQPRPETRIACIDVGGGTSDLMIASYQCQSNPGGDKIVGETLHRDGLSRAGDHLVQRLLEEIIVPHFAHAMSMVKESHIRFLFGKGVPSNRRIRRQRIHWMNRLWVPLAHAYLDEAVNAPDAANAKANKKVISHTDANVVGPDVVDSLQQTINAEWGALTYNVKQKLNLRYDKTKFEKIVDEVFGELLFDFCQSIVEHNADVVLLAGLPSKLPYIRRLVETYLPLPKSRIVPMHGWYAGSWYPYQNPDNVNPGVIVDPKSTVVVGAAIEFCAKHGKLPQFNFELNDTAAKSSFYWGVMSESRIDAERVLFEANIDDSSESDQKQISVSNENLIIGRKRRSRNNAQASPVYRLRALRGSSLGKIDFKITFQRRRNENDEEEIVVGSVDGTVDDEPAVYGKNVLFDWRTLSDERYYLDTGGLDKIKL